MAHDLRCFASLLLLFYAPDLAGSVEVILGKSFTFAGTAGCRAAEGKLVLTGLTGPDRRVAVHRQGVWEPDDYYRGRVSSGPSVSFNRTVFTDGGTYELICDDSRVGFEVIQLKVLVPSYASVTEGDAAKLQLNHHTGAKPPKCVTWVKHGGKLVFERSFSSGEDRYGAGYEGRVSMSHEAYREGDLSLDVRRTQVEDAGDYFSYVSDETGEKFVAAVRLTVNKQTWAQTNASTQPPTQICAEDKGSATWTIVVSTLAFLLVAILCGLLGWCLKSRCSRQRVSL